MPDQKFGQQLLQNVGSQAAGGAVGQILGLVTAGINDRRQIRQQQKLQDMQIRGQQQMLDYSKAKDLEMWRETSYPAQVEMLKKAGLNAGLMYGMGGGGGTTTGGSGPGVSGAQAPSGGGEIMGLMNAGMQAQMMAAQTELMKANADKARADAENARGAVRENLGAQTSSLLEGIKTQKTVQDVNRAEAALKGLESEFQGRSMEDRLHMIDYNTTILYNAMWNSKNEREISEQTYKDKIQIVHEEKAQAILRTGLMQIAQRQGEASINLTNAQISKTLQDIKNSIITTDNDSKRVMLQSISSSVENSLRQQGIELQKGWLNQSENQMWLNALMGAVSLGRTGNVTTHNYEGQTNLKEIHINK